MGYIVLSIDLLCFMAEFASLPFGKQTTTVNKTTPTTPCWIRLRPGLLQFPSRPTCLRLRT